MNVRSRLAMLLLSCLCTTGVFIGCHKDNADKQQQPYSTSTFSLKEARSYFYKQVRPALALRQQTSARKPGKLYPLWDKAKTYNAGDYLLVEVPAFYEKRQLLTIRTAASDNATARTAAPTKAELGSFDRLLFYKFKDGTIKERIVTYIPDSSYMAHHQYDASHNYLWALDKDFSGYVVHCTLEGKPFMALKMKDAKIISRLDYDKAAARKTKDNAKWVEKCTTESITIGWESVCIIVVVDDPGNGYIGYEECHDVAIIEIVQTCTDVWEEDPVDCWQTPHAPGCPGSGTGGGGGGTDPQPCGDDNPCPPAPPQYIVVGPAADEIQDIHSYLATAFDLYAPAKMILCTRQPVRGSRAVVSGNDLGTTFVTFEQMRNGNLVRRTIGFHPATTVNLLSQSAPMRFGNDQTYFYNVKLEANITAAQFQQTYDLIDIAGTGNFNIKSYNSQYLGYQIADEVLGTGITKTMTSINGSTPDMWGAGDLGEDLKAVGGVAVPAGTYPLPDAN